MDHQQYDEELDLGLNPRGELRELYRRGRTDPPKRTRPLGEMRFSSRARPPGRTWTDLRR